MADLFEHSGPSEVTSDPPLSEKLRPKVLTEVLGQSHLIGSNMILSRLCSNEMTKSIIFWGPPGVGKTTIARLLANEMNNVVFVQCSAVSSGLTELRTIFNQARHMTKQGKKLLLFVDEIHRFNKTQQDAFLPLVEEGVLMLVGATTENPSFEINTALLSRCIVLSLNSLSMGDLESLLNRAEIEMRRKLPLEKSAREYLKEITAGDGRVLLNMAEQVFYFKKTASVEDLKLQLHTPQIAYDKAGDRHYDISSAIHKSIRASDTDAALYWLARALCGGEDPRFLARRLTRIAVEDVGLADQNALTMCLDAWKAYERIGSPDGELFLAEATVYLSLCPKSNSIYQGFANACSDAVRTSEKLPPMHLMNAPTKLMKDIGRSKGYVYDHDTAEGVSGQNCFPDGMKRGVYYFPVDRGNERELKKRLQYFAKIRSDRSK